MSKKGKYNNILNSSKRGQITLFIIVAILIVAGIILFLTLRQKVAVQAPAEAEVITNPNTFLKSCIEGEIQDNIKTLEFQGGSLQNPLNIRFKFGNEAYYNISYLCYTETPYISCVVQEPFIITHMQDELSNAINSDLESCFSELIKSYETKGYSVSKTYKDFDLSLNEDKIDILITGQITATKGNQTIKQKDFAFSTPTKIYNLGKIAEEIIESETKYNYFDASNYITGYPEYDVYIFKTNDQSKVYTITNTKTNEKFRFAVRGGIIPA